MCVSAAVMTVALADVSCVVASLDTQLLCCVLLGCVLHSAARRLDRPHTLQRAGKAILCCAHNNKLPAE